MSKFVCPSFITGLIIALLLAGCNTAPTPKTTPTPPVKLTLYNWAEYMPQSVLDAFTEEYGIPVE